MFKFTNLSNEPKQQITMMVDDNNSVVFNFEYKPNCAGWFFGFKYGDINYQNMRLVTAYNILRAYRNYLPFGLRCDTTDTGEPMDIDDFVSGYATVYLLTKEDVKAVEANYYGKMGA